MRGGCGLKARGPLALLLVCPPSGIQTIGIGMPETRYPRSGDVMVAYQVVGEGPLDVVIAPPGSPTWSCSGRRWAGLRSWVVLPSMHG